MGAGFGGGSGQLESIDDPGRCSARCSSGQAEMGEDLGDHGGMFDGGDDLQGATALGALLDVDLEHSFTKAPPIRAPSVAVPTLMTVEVLIPAASAGSV
jgi:hypothetical protein